MQYVQYVQYVQYGGFDSDVKRRRIGAEGAGSWRDELKCAGQEKDDGNRKMKEGKQLIVSERRPKVKA